MRASEQGEYMHSTLLACWLNVPYQVVRLHRPFLIKGLENPASKYAYSAKMCISSARTICNGLENDSESEMVLFWYTYGQVLGAVICICSKEALSRILYSHR